MLRHRTTAFVCVCLIAVVGSLRSRREGAAAGRGRPSAPTPGSARSPTPISRAISSGIPTRSPCTACPAAATTRCPTTRSTRCRAWQAKEDAWLAQAQADRPRRPSTAPPLRGTYAIVREALEASIGARVCRNELWTVSQFVNGWQVQDGYTVTIQPVGHRRGAEGGARALEPAAEVHRHRDRQPARRAQGRLLRAEGQRPHRHRPDGHADRDADRGIAVRFAVGARQDARRSRRQFDAAGPRADRARRSSATATSCRRNTCRRRARRSACRRTRTAPPATTRRSATTARCRCRRARSTRPACARSSGSTRR